MPAATIERGAGGTPGQRSSAGSRDRLTSNPDLDTMYAAGCLVGYARVSRDDQVLDRQIDALTQAGCTKVFTDHGVSGARASRPGLDECLAYLRPGDTLVVQALDRLGRTTRHLLDLAEVLLDRDIGLRILTLGIDTRTPAGRVVLTVMAALAEMERSLLIERTTDGIAAARARGRVGGRRHSLDAEQRAHVRELHDAGRSQAEIARLLGTSRATVQRALACPSAERGADPDD